MVVIGGGGHGLATAYYLAAKHGVRNVAVLEKGWLGGGNSGRNTQVTRSNYFYPSSTQFFNHSLKLYETLSRDLNFNVMLSQRGLVNIASSPHELEIMRRWANTIYLNGVDAEMLTPADIQRLLPPDQSQRARAHRRRVHSATRRDLAARRRELGFCPRADSWGVDIIQSCEVHSINKSGRPGHWGEHEPGGHRRREGGASLLSGHSSHIARLAGFRLPLTSMTLQAMVTEPIKPVLDTVLISPGCMCT